jgi:hypothetical protein
MRLERVALPIYSCVIFPRQKIIFALDNGIEKFSPDGARTTFAANPIN